jgi:hypothetical protein
MFIFFITTTDIPIYECFSQVEGGLEALEQNLSGCFT